MNKHEQQGFFDQAFSENIRQSLGKFYAINKAIRLSYTEYLRDHVPGKRVLECGCGPGSFALYIAKQDAKQVIGIDISEVGIERANRYAQEQNLNNAIFYVMDIEAMDFEDNSFDIVCGSGILHHLTLETACSELVRVLTPEGRASFLEPLGYNPVFNLFRWLTPGYRVKTEHPLKKHDLNVISRHFKYTDFRFYYLFTLLAVPFRRMRIFSDLVAFLHSVDQGLFKMIPGLKFLAWQLMIVAERPLSKSGIDDDTLN